MWRQKQPKFIAHVLHHTSVYVNSVHFSSVLQHFSHACTSQGPRSNLWIEGPSAYLPRGGEGAGATIESPLINSQDEKTNLHQICLVQICCKYEICKALQPVQRWQSPNLHKNGQIRRLPPLHWSQSFANFIFATYLHKANLMQIPCSVLFQLFSVLLIF